MKSKLLIGLILLVVLGGGVFLLLTRGDKDQKSANNETSQGSSTKNSDAGDKTSSNFLPKQKVGQAPDCSLYSMEDISKIWGVAITDTDHQDSKVIQINGPQNYQYECSYNETDSGSGLNF